MEATVCRQSLPDCTDFEGFRVDVWGVEAGYGEERAEGELVKDKDDADWVGDGGCFPGGRYPCGVCGRGV